jgi:GNAT superfamily N-acetyltransferase
LIYSNVRERQTNGDKMAIALSPATAQDVPELGRILYTAFQTLADHHNFPRDFPSIEVASGVLSMLIANPGFYGVAAEEDGRLTGSNFVDLRSPIAGIGPISVDPSVQNKGTGRRLMQGVMDEAVARNAAGIRLVQAAYHNRSLSLYTKLGFATRETLSLMQGNTPRARFPGYEVTNATPKDAEACNRLCRTVHGFERAGEVQEAIQTGRARVVGHQGRVTGYATDIGFFAHAVAETNRDLIALIATAPEYSGPGFLLPTRNHEVFSWCLDNGLRLVMQMTLMTIGLYNEPQGAYLPTILY